MLDVEIAVRLFAIGGFRRFGCFHLTLNLRVSDAVPIVASAANPAVHVLTVAVYLRIGRWFA